MTAETEKLNLNRLYKDRSVAINRQNRHYLRLLFNDHFVVFLLIVVGAAILAFQSLAKKSLETPIAFLPSYWQLGLIAWLVLGQQFGSFVTYLKPADRVFLAASDDFLTKTYLNQAWCRSFILATGWQVAFLGLAWPVMNLIGLDHPLDWSLSLLTLVASKAFMLVQALDRHERGNTWTGFDQTRAGWLIRLAMPFVLALAIVLLPDPWRLWILSGLTVILVAVAVAWFVQHQKAQRAIDWHVALTTSQRHSQAVWQFYGLFAQVPNQGAVVKRRAYLDNLLGRFSFQKEPMRRLFWIKLLRGGDELVLVLRLVVVGLILLVVLPKDSYYLQAAGMAVLIYLINFQLLPVFEKTRVVLWSRLAFADKNQQEKTFLVVLAEITSTVTGLTFLMMLLIAGPAAALAVLAGGLLLALVLYGLWLPKTLHKKN
ncbi:Bacterial ABC transporter protein EcsB [Fructobacillus sp. EFB-N1]|uniref:ABC transporter permease n=1 Tax=Fructobacillus sp. EFB-N1 TaxID=1658766 RepID=UPI00064D7363|nr:ABC transporter permease [Fructobacillus sp. EFB-N1]KMK53180.1 Bacterial ABC transporter protein EcsB [Fructobacillus sp. EFB-N1]